MKKSESAKQLSKKLIPGEFVWTIIDTMYVPKKYRCGIKYGLFPLVHKVKIMKVNYVCDNTISLRVKFAGDKRSRDIVFFDAINCISLDANAIYKRHRKYINMHVKYHKDMLEQLNNIKRFT